jgi:dihydrofolate reductase
MGQIVLDIMSLDGFVTAPNDRPGRGLGDDGEILHYWGFGRRWTYENQEEVTREVGASSGVDQLVIDEMMEAGAAVVGRRMYDITDGWGGSSPFGACVVVTHRVVDQPDPLSGFEFVDGIDEAVQRARQIAGDQPVAIGGGATITQQALRAGLVDELQIHVAPVILGGGRPLVRRARRAAVARARPRVAVCDAHALPRREVSRLREDLTAVGVDGLSGHRR